MYNSQFGGTTSKTNVHYRGRKYSTKVEGTVFKKKCQIFFLLNHGSAIVKIFHLNDQPRMIKIAGYLHMKSLKIPKE
jgi:hypothetical protein